MRLAVVAVTAALTLGGATASSSSSSSSSSSKDGHEHPQPKTLHGLPFGPFDSGSARQVRRQGKTGKSRAKHPVVGAVGQIPGGGPPPPALRRDPDVPEANTSPNAAPGLGSNPLYLASLFYSQFLTRTDGPRCQHLPTCSRFASQAVARHGLIGIPIGLDRVIQPGVSSALRTLPDIEFGGVLRHWDPLENYEFWKPEQFTGFPAKTAEEPLALPRPTSPSTSKPTSPVASPKGDDDNPPSQALDQKPSGTP